MKIRVAHLVHSMAYGGIETIVLNWLGAIDRDRFEVHLFCFANPGETETQFVEAAARRGFDTVRIPWSRRKPVFRSARLLARHLRERRIDILHCHNTYAQLVTVVAARLAPVRTIATYYVWGRFGWKRGLLQWADRLTMPLLDEVSAQCEDALAATVWLGMPAVRVRLLTCGNESSTVRLGPGERALRRRELGVQDRDVVLIYVARFWPEKAHDVMLRGFRRVLNQRPEAMLWLAGDGPCLSAAQALSEDLGLTSRTRFLGYRTDVADLLALADIQVHPSDLEGVPLAVCEGMAAGLPIVATATGGIPEVLRHEESGLLIERQRPDRLAAAVLRLIGDPGECTRLGAGARRFIEQEYSLRAATARLEAVYESMVRP